MYENVTFEFAALANGLVFKEPRYNRSTFFYFFIKKKHQKGLILIIIKVNENYMI